MTDTSRLTGRGAPLLPLQRTSESGAGPDPVPGMKEAVTADLHGGSAPTAAGPVTT